MDGPKVTDNDFTERTGINEVARIVNDARCIWRETPLRGVGIDGQIEYVSPAGIASGRLVGVQVKSGPSYFVNERDGVVPYNIPGRHADYWARFALPVILVLHDPVRSLTAWTDARAALRRGENPAFVPLANAFDADGVLRALQATGPLPEAASDIKEIWHAMMRATTGSGGFVLSFFELFCHGLTDLAYSVYFNMDLVMEIAEANAYLAEWEHGIGVGHTEYTFLDRYVAFLVAHDLARVDFDAWHQAEVERGMTASFIAPLTRRGRMLVEFVAESDRALLGASSDFERVTEERSVQILPLRMLERGARMRKLMGAALEDQLAQPGPNASDNDSSKNGQYGR